LHNAGKAFDIARQNGRVDRELTSVYERSACALCHGIATRLSHGVAVIVGFIARQFWQRSGIGLICKLAIGHFKFFFLVFTQK
jgi:hypothetical protein